MTTVVLSLTDDDLEQEARDTLILMNEGIPYDAVQKMHPRIKVAFMRALAALTCDEAEADGDEVPVGGVN